MEYLEITTSCPPILSQTRTVYTPLPCWSMTLRKFADTENASPSAVHSDAVIHGTVTFSTMLLLVEYALCQNRSASSDDPGRGLQG